MRSPWPPSPVCSANPREEAEPQIWSPLLDTAHISSELCDAGTTLVSGLRQKGHITSWQRIQLLVQGPQALFPLPQFYELVCPP